MPAGALAELTSQYRDGADPVAVLRELAEVTHWVSVVKHIPEAADDPTVSPEFRNRATAMAKALATRATARTWQMLLAALDEISSAPNSMMAAEMAVIRLTHVADLPTPEELVKRLESEESKGGGGIQIAEIAPAREESISEPQKPNLNEISADAGRANERAFVDMESAQPDDADQGDSAGGGARQA